MTEKDRLARLAGLLYLILLPTVGVAFGSGQSLLGPDATATLAGLQRRQGVFELGILLGSIGFIDFLLLALVLHRLFSPVDRAAANLLLAFVAVSVPLSLAAIAQRLNVLLLLNGAAGLPSLVSEQGAALAMAALHASNSLILLSAIFWGLWLVPLGQLVLRCGFMPRFFGVLLLLGSVFYVLLFAGPVLDPGYANSTLARVVGVLFGLPGIVGEFGTALWLLLLGAREGRGSWSSLSS